jgi:hypothetical protein
VLDVSPSHGDQLLVHKHAYTLHGPRRWDAAVFHNPHKPTQAYVKRIVGLPGERMTFRNGDLYADGDLCRKSLKRQRALRIPVHDFQYQPASQSPDWEPRWQPESSESDWTAIPGGFRYQGPHTSTQDSPLEWIRYRHWIRSGGSHMTSVAMSRSASNAERRVLDDSPVDYDPALNQLSCRGVLSLTARDRLLAQSTSRGLSRAISELQRRSHEAPVTDDYGYNRASERQATIAVRDLMLATRVRFHNADGLFAIEMTDGKQTFRTTLDVSQNSVRLNVDDDDQPVRQGRSLEFSRPGSMLLEMSIIDRQVLLAVNGYEPFAPWPIPLSETQIGASASPVRIRIGARGLRTDVESLKLYRDIQYTSKGDESTYQLGEDEYFVLGDNSPISFDSRSWQHCGVARHLLMGKPILVHLPSKPGEFSLAGRRFRIRIPDLPRIRYIR